MRKLLSFSLALLLSVGALAQNVTLNLRGVTVQEAVTQLQSQGNYTIVINSDEVDLQKRISVSAKDAPLTEVLSQIFAGQNLDFSVKGNSVSVTKHRSVTPPPAKASVFRGVVTDAEGEPLAGATLLEAGKRNYALTDLHQGCP